MSAVEPFTEKDLTLHALDAEREVWLGACARVERSGGYDGVPLLAKKNSMNRIDHLLDQLLELQGGRTETAL